jgi:hypothetical protein
MERELGEEDRLAAVDGAQDRTAQTRPAVFDPQLPPVDLGPLASRFGLHCPAHLQKKILNTARRGQVYILNIYKY